MSITFYPNYIPYAGFSASAEPSITTQGYTCSGGETSGAAYDLVDNSRDNLITIDTDGEATDFTVDFDLTNNIAAADFVIVDNVNLLTASAEVRITNSGSSPLLQSIYAGTINNELTLVSELEWSDLEEYPASVDMFLSSLSVTDNNWEIEFRDYDGSNYAADVTIGEVAIGKKFTTNFNAKIGLIKSSDWGVDLLRSKGGNKYGFKSYGEARRWVLEWEYIDATEKANFETVWQVTEGQRYPFYIDLGENTNPTLYYVRFAMSELQFTELVTNVWKCKIVIEEEI